MILLIDERDALEFEKRLNCVRDVHLLARNPPLRLPMLPAAALNAILIQKGIRLCKRNHAIAKQNIDRIWREWTVDRKSLTALSRKWCVLPVTLSHIFRERWGLTRHDLHLMIHEVSHPEHKPKDRIEKELREASMEDYIHAPKAVEYMIHKGRMGESLCSEKLKQWGVRSKSEREQQSALNGGSREGVKTPDFLFEKKERLPGIPGEFHWLESKATFGNLRECRSDYMTQVKYYLEKYGSGCIIYWLGCTIEGKEGLEKAGVKVLSAEDLMDSSNRKRIEEFLNEGMVLS